MHANPYRFKCLLEEALDGLKSCGKNLQDSKKEIGSALGKKPSYIDYLRREDGNLPKVEDLQPLVRQIYMMGYKNKVWVRNILLAGGHPEEHVPEATHEITGEYCSTIRHLHLLRNVPLKEDFLPSSMVGFDDYIDKLAEKIQGGRARFLSIEGIGGIGKTTLAIGLAEKLAREMNDVTDIFWVTAKQEIIHYDNQVSARNDAAISFSEIMSQLYKQMEINTTDLDTAEKFFRYRIKSNRYLIIIDNIETVEDIDKFMKYLSDLSASPMLSCFIFTSRRNILSKFHIISEEDRIMVKQLTSEQVFQLVSRLLPDSRTVTNEEIDKLCEVIGGIPLAIKIVIGSLMSINLDELIEKLKELKSQTTDPDVQRQLIFDHIYKQAWMQLSAMAKKVLIITGFFVSPKGATRDFLADKVFDSQGDMSSLLNSLSELTDRYLMEVTGSLKRPIYKIHQLTRTFVQAEFLVMPSVRNVSRTK